MNLPDLFQIAFDNTAYRKVLFTGPNSQVAVMNLSPEEESQGDLLSVDKIIIVLAGQGTVALADPDGQSIEHHITVGSMVGIEAETKHVLWNSGQGDLKLIVMYAPPQFPADTVHGTRDAAVIDPYDNPEDE